MKLLLCAVCLVVAASMSAAVGCSSRRDGGHVDDAGSEPDAGVPFSIPGWKLDWAVRAGGTASVGSQDIGREVAALPDGSVLMVGAFADTAVFGEGTPNETAITSNGGYREGFLAKYDSDGSVEWVTSFGGECDDEAYSVAALDDGTSFVAGRFEFEAEFEGEDGPVTVLSPDGWSAFVARFSPQGRAEWVSVVGESPYSDALAARLSADGRLIVVGRFKESIVGGAGEHEHDLLSQGSTDCFLASFSLDGEVEWVRGFGSIDSDNCWSIDVLPDGSAVVAGAFSSELVSKEEEAECAGEDCWFSARLGVDGEPIWLKSHEVTNQGWAPSIIAMSTGEIVLSGLALDVSSFLGIADTAACSGKGIAAIWMSSESGDEIRREAFCTPGTDEYFGVPCRLMPLSDGRFFLIGNFFGDLFLSPGDELAFTSAMALDFFVSSFDKDGEIEGLYSMGSTDWDAIFSSAALEDHTVFLTGTYASTNGYPTCFGTGNDDDVCLDSEGEEDIFLMKLVRTAVPPR